MASEKSKQQSAQKVEVTTHEEAPAPREDAYAPLVDIYETPEGMTVLVAEVPGASADAVDVRVDKGVLTIQAQGKVQEPPEKYSRTYVGFCGLQYYRAFALSDEIDRDRIEASLADGVLTVNLPKAAAAKTRKIQIKAG